MSPENTLVAILFLKTRWDEDGIGETLTAETSSLQEACTQTASLRSNRTPLSRAMKKAVMAARTLTSMTTVQPSERLNATLAAAVKATLTSCVFDLYTFSSQVNGNEAASTYLIMKPTHGGEWRVSDPDSVVVRATSLLLDLLCIAGVVFENS